MCGTRSDHAQDDYQQWTARNASMESSIFQTSCNLLHDGKLRDCAVCSNCKVHGGRQQTVYFCKTCTCQPGLHPSKCFERYHTMKDYKAAPTATSCSLTSIGECWAAVTDNFCCFCSIICNSVYVDYDSYISWNTFYLRLSREMLHSNAAACLTRVVQLFIIHY